MRGVMSLQYNHEAEQLLSEQGYYCEPEPAWVDGEVPDFLCRGKAELWVEVKSFREPDLEAAGRVAEWLNEQSHKFQATGRADAFISDETSQKDIKHVLRLADRALQEAAASGAPPHRLYAVVPSNPEYDRFIKINLQMQDEEEILYSCRSSTGRYGRPLSHSRIDRKQVVIVTDDQGETLEILAQQLGLLDDDFRLALALQSTSDPFRVSSVMSRGAAPSPIRKVNKIRAQARDANRKFKNACKYRNVACLMMIFDDTPLGDEESFLGAFYGDLQVTWPVHGQAGPALHFGPNGFWNQGQNRTTSAACYLRKSTQPMLIHNCWARTKLPTGLVAAIEHVPQEDGTFNTM
jgi:hypothetical protein